MPYVFTEQGVAMLSALLRSEIAVQVSIQIMQAFVNMRKFIATNAAIFQRLDKLELKQLETDQKFEQVFKALESGSTPKQLTLDAEKFNQQYGSLQVVNIICQERPHLSCTHPYFSLKGYSPSSMSAVPPSNSFFHNASTLSLVLPATRNDTDGLN
ncbi:MAG: hypothetical protein A2X43_08605 [Candidatus Margulisbacteria bacterium GWD2_39_127]|nr:MAG: hypothetical protein A2X43_08605 [Candidatus Margulisbacteria bacterium GWD2_39_127]